jgi:integral membrane sensor domain MASE1
VNEKENISSMDNQSLSSDQIKKWQSMSVIVDYYPVFKRANLTRQFKKLAISRLITENLLVFLFQFTGLNFTTLSGHPSSLWFASGTACAYMFLRGNSVLPGIALGSFFAYFLAHTKMSITFACTAIFTGQAYILLWLSYQFISPSLVFHQISTMMKFLISSAVLTALSSLLLEMICFPDQESFSQWLHMWLANLNGLLVFAIALATWDAYFPEIHSLRTVKKSKLMLLFGLLLGLTMALMFQYAILITFIIAFVWCALILIISSCYGWCGSVAAVFLSGLLWGIAAYIGPPFFTGFTESATLVLGQSFLLLGMVGGMIDSISNDRS